MLYTDKVLSHFKNPHNQGSMDDADSVGEKGNPSCGDVMKIYLKIKDDKIDDIKFETFGCAAAIAVTSAMTDLAKGRELDDAATITKEEIIKELGDLPPAKVHCSMLGLEALNEAITNYKTK